jgi:hypothetical protein
MWALARSGGAHASQPSTIASRNGPSSTSSSPVPIPRHPDANALLAKARDEVAVSLAELRDLARGPHPAVLSALGLAVTL